MPQPFCPYEEDTVRSLYNLEEPQPTIYPNRGLAASRTVRNTLSKNKFSWPRHSACGILVPGPCQEVGEFKRMPLALKEQSLNRWTAREVLRNTSMLFISHPICAFC